MLQSFFSSHFSFFAPLSIRNLLAHERKRQSQLCEQEILPEDLEERGVGVAYTIAS